MFIRLWIEKERNWRCYAHEISIDYGQKYCHKIAKTYCITMGFGDSRLDGVVLRNPFVVF